MRFLVHHFLAWGGLENDFDSYKSASTTLPNSVLDAEHVGSMFHESLNQLVLAESLGFDGVSIGESHQSAYGLTPSPNLLASTLARETERIQIAVLGNALPLQSSPVRVAEELAMIDCLSRGRLIAGLDVGSAPDYYSTSVNPTHARSMHAEAFDLIMRCWGEPGPFAHFGEHWRLKYVNPWPTPIQQPTPEFWITGDGSRESIDFAAAKQCCYLATPHYHRDFHQRNLQLLQKAAKKQGNEINSSRLGWQVPIYVAESDERAWTEFEPHLQYLREKLLKGRDIIAPGFSSPRSIAAINKAAPQYLANIESRSDIESGGFAIVGSPSTVSQRLSEELQQRQIGTLFGVFQVGSLPDALTRNSMKLFAEQVLPSLRETLTS